MFNCVEIEKKIGYTFRNKKLLETAFTHVSYGKTWGVADNERLEYLGDAVLELLITEKQYFESVATEGAMTKSRQTLVSKLPLKEAVERMGIEEYIRYVGGKDNVGDKTVSSLYESLLAAIYLDGGMEEAKAFLTRNPLLGGGSLSNNYKGDLQEFLQKKGKDLPVYTFEKEGMDNAPTFYCKVNALGFYGEGRGGTKRAAQQLAAKELLEKLQAKDKKKIAKQKGKE